MRNTRREAAHRYETGRAKLQAGVLQTHRYASEPLTTLV